ncbi:hypothetical protein ACFL5E_03995, partial [Candidatus Omnitrophota bacterium]
MVAKKKTTKPKKSAKSSKETRKKSTLVEMYETVNVPTLELEEYVPQAVVDDSVEDLIGGS